MPAIGPVPAICPVPVVHPALAAGHGAGTGGRVLATYMSGRRSALPDTLDAYPAGLRLRRIEAHG